MNTPEFFDCSFPIVIFDILRKLYNTGYKCNCVFSKARVSYLRIRASLINPMQSLQAELMTNFLLFLVDNQFFEIYV
jgi:hypothetical protein